MLKAKVTRRDHEGKQQAIEAASKEDTTRLNAEIPMSLHNRVKMRAIQEGRGSTITSIIIRALTEYLETPINK